MGSQILMGTGSVILQKIKIASGSRISANSFLHTNVKTKSLIHGNPGKKIKFDYFNFKSINFLLIGFKILILLIMLTRILNVFFEPPVL